MDPRRDHSPRSDDFLYGRRPVWEAFRAGKRSMHKVWMVPGTSGGVIEEILELARARGVPIEWIKRDHLDRMVRGKGNHQGVAAQVSATAYLELEDFLAGLPAGSEEVVVALDEIEDPQNVGTILRNASFFGVSAVIVPRWRSAPVGNTAVRASSGAAEHISAIRVRNLVDAIEKLKEAGFEVYGADMAGEPLGTHVPGKRQALILGSEGKGLRRLVKEHCDKLIGIPARNQVGSLNVASASAIFLYKLTAHPNLPT
jgi:23S rRNA (guanosine2251-2'-O)-methyltransferase